MKHIFARSTITRTCHKKYSDYRRFKDYLKKDFNNRCAYCDLYDLWIEPLPYQIDHFIPMKEIKAAKRFELETTYSNLMYACPVCNRLKSDMFSGSIDPCKIENQLFYNPDNDNMNDHFYRDDKGRIMSDDKKGKEIIERLQLYRPTKQWGWYLDELYEVYQILEARIKTETNSEVKEKYEIARNQVGNALFQKRMYFAHSYKNKR